MSSVILTAAQNTFVASAQPNNNFSFYPLLYTGTDKAFGTCISFLKFDFTAVATHKVDSALLNLSVIEYAGGDVSNILVNRVTQHFDAFHVTYATLPELEPVSAYAKINCHDQYNTVQVDITQLVNAWLSGASENFGIALASSDSKALVQFGSDSIGWEPYFPKLILDYSDIQPVAEGVYGYVYNTGSETIAPGENVPFSDNGFLNSIEHTDGSCSINIVEDGTYGIWYSVAGQTPNQFALYRNNTLVPGSAYGICPSEGSTNTGMTILSAQKDDQLTLRNYKGNNPVTLSNYSDVNKTIVTASVLIMKLGPLQEPAALLTAVNQSQTEEELRAAVTHSELDLDLEDFYSISEKQQSGVLSALLTKRPFSGYSGTAAIQAVLSEALDASVDTANIYVEAGASDGAGNPLHPLGTIEEALCAVEAGGTIHLSGTFEIANTINITKIGVTLLGVDNPTIIPTTDSIPFIINAPAVSLNGITISNLERRPTELVRIISSDAKIINCNLSGPKKTITPQLLAGITAVEDGADNFIIENNRISSLDTAIHLMEASKGVVAANNISDVRVGIKIDGATVKLMENSWLGPRNDSDVVVTARTHQLEPYIELEEISLKNNNAYIADEES